MLTKQELEKKVANHFALEITMGNLSVAKFVDFIQVQILQYCKPKCINCYDKGYSTSFYGLSSSSDSDANIRLLYCVCERGQDLKKLIEKNYVEK